MVVFCKVRVCMYEEVDILHKDFPSSKVIARSFISVGIRQGSENIILHLLKGVNWT